MTQAIFMKKKTKIMIEATSMDKFSSYAFRMLITTTNNRTATEESVSVFL